jgi:DNA-binding transcriptional LysR family regulator
LRNGYQDLRVSLTEADSGEAVELVERGDADLAIVHDWTNAPLPVPGGLARVLLLEDVADVAVPAGHALAGRQGADLAELGSGPWICGMPGTLRGVAGGLGPASGHPGRRDRAAHSGHGGRGRMG